MAVTVLLLHLLGWGRAPLGAIPQVVPVGEAGYGVSLGLTAYLLGVRHAFDADHVVAVDSTTRKLVGEGKPALSGGFWFSLGHCSVVLALSFLLALGLKAVAGPNGDGPPRLQSTIQLLGSTTAGAFLVLLGLTNLVAAAGIARVARRVRRYGLDEAELGHQLGK